VRSRSPLPATSVAIHFDDFYRDVYRYAYPILKTCGLRGTVFVPTGFVGSDRVFAHDISDSPFRFENGTEEDLREMLADGMEAGAHTVNHLDLGSIPIAEAEQEVAGSVKELTRMTGAPTRMFSYPFGARKHIRTELRDTVRNAGCDCMFSAYGGFVNSRSDLFDIRRLAPSSYYSPLSLALELEGLSLGSLANTTYVE
jgi:peptidoglycan/xylan/chitin deacetylase (PgdA/CDA1 family)